MGDDRKDKANEEADALFAAESDINAVARHVLQESLRECQEDIRLLTEKQKRLNRQKKALRDYIAALRDLRDAVLDRARATGIDLCHMDREGKAALARLFREQTRRRKPADEDEARLCYELGIPDRVPPSGIKTIEELDSALAAYEEQLQTIGDDAELAMLALQQAINRKTQVVTMLSNIMKSQHDTMMSIIRNLK